VAAGPAVGVFTDDPETAAAAVDCLRIVSYGYVFYAWGMVMLQALNGAGDTMTPTWISLFSFWMCQIPLAWWLANGLELGPRGVFWAIAVGESLHAVVGILVFRRGRWKTRQV
jgi:Na+-driven multidrug efflux pump